MGIITIKDNKDFRRIFARGASRVGPALVVYGLAGEVGTTRFGFTVSKKVGKAVVRNRLRRVLKEICRLHPESFRPGMDYVVIARPRARDLTYRELATELLSLAGDLP
ncbi:MAG: ribonuclease P protein component [Thermoanaerobacterales bacterium]|nr:ribonuclease P protein component [Bacillota bacterium]MDI6907753.1 ribonuclease P protein component [Thermoanaerobacterales bacterium]